MTELIIVIIVIGVAGYWLDRKYTSGGILLAAVIIVTQIAALALLRIVGPFGFSPKPG